jgi:hypothetical protein
MDGWAWTQFFWLKVGTNSGLLHYGNDLRFPRNSGFSLWSEELLGARQEPCTIELVFMQAYVEEILFFKFGLTFKNRASYI